MYATKNLGQSNEQYWEIPLIITSGNTTTPNNLVPVLYSSNATIPKGGNVQYWLEGINAGNITLKFTYTRGSTKLVYQQHFLVCTQQTKFDWQQDIRQAVLLESNNTVDLNYYQQTNDGAGYIFFLPSPFMTNIRYLQNIYRYYGELYLNSNDMFLWAGLGDAAGGPVYGGLMDAQYARTLTLPSYASQWSALTPLASNYTDYVQDKFVYANWLIFNDLAWQFRAYQASGIWALRYTRSSGYDIETGSDTPIDVTNWNLMYLGTDGAQAREERGSRASRRPSPTKLRAKRVRAKKRLGKMRIRGVSSTDGQSGDVARSTELSPRS
jgi:hypothetical protein